MEANTHRHVAQRNLDLVGGSEDLASLVAMLGTRFGAGQQLAIGFSAVGSADLTGAVRRGQSSQRETPGGWNNTAISIGAETQPIAAVRPTPDGLRFFDLRDAGRMPDPRDPLGGGEQITGELDEALPDLLRQALGLPSLSGRLVAAAIAGVDRPGILRFVLADRDGNIGGYSILVAAGGA
jgi:hypothetical protein